MAQENDSIPRKGSYRSFTFEAIEDNSMYIEEAFNQESGIIQHISNLIVEDGNVVYSYTQEIPLAGDRHQLSFGVNYNSFKRPEFLQLNRSAQFTGNGVGDFNINYRPMLWGRDHWALVIPRFTMIIPTGDARYGFGSGGWGGQFNLAVTKRISERLVTHYNAGYTLLAKADCYNYDTEGNPSFIKEENLTVKNLGMSAIWLATPKLNLMCEFAASIDQEFDSQGQIDLVKNSIINPGFRFAIDIGKVQIVPGAGVPLNFTNRSFEGTGIFFYLSIEPAY